jgi:hypothetical protein
MGYAIINIYSVLNGFPDYHQIDISVSLKKITCCNKTSMWRFFNTEVQEATMDSAKVLEEYRIGDDAKRMSLFLAYRELREQFSGIEQESSHDDFTLIRFPWSKKNHIERAA